MVVRQTEMVWRIRWLAVIAYLLATHQCIAVDNKDAESQALGAGTFDSILSSMYTDATLNLNTQTQLRSEAPKPPKAVKGKEGPNPPTDANKVVAQKPKHSDISDDASETPIDAAIGSSSNKDNEKIIPLSAVIPPNYNAETLPKPPKGPVQVKLRILLEQIYGVKQIDRTITVGLRTFCLWKDPKLKYDVKILGGGMNYFQVNPNNIWTPRVEILNVVGSEVTYQSAQVFPDGSVFLTTRLMSIVTVRFAAQWFPFDSQNFIFEYGELGYSKDLVYLNTTTTDWAPAFATIDADDTEELQKLETEVEKAQDAEVDDPADTKRAIASATTEEKYKEPVEVLQHGNFILGMNVVEDKHGDAYWVVDNFTGWQDLRYGEGARYYFVGISTLLEMHRGRMHFILVYIVPLVFIVIVSQVNWFFDVRDLDPRMSIASGLLLCMVAFQYTIEQEIPKVSYPLWINYYLVGCYATIVLQCGLMALTLRLAGPRASTISVSWTRATADSTIDIAQTDEKLSPMRLQQQRNEARAIRFNYICSFAYPSFFLLFNLMMFGLVAVYT